MNAPARRDQPFPCPFCGSGSIEVIGDGPRFMHYRCDACSEFWTGMKLRPVTARSSGRRLSLDVQEQDKNGLTIH